MTTLKMLASQIKDIDKIIRLLKEEVKQFKNPIATEIGETHENQRFSGHRKSKGFSRGTKNPFPVLISCILSLRTKDTTTGPASKRLFELADNPYDMIKLSTKQIEKAIFPVGFYPTKTKWIKQVCRILIENYNGRVPDKEEELLKLPGIGRKCMGVVMCYGHFKEGFLPIDTHCHRIPNRLGWIKTKRPEQTEEELKKIIPKKYWRDLNNLLVAHGQNICVPISPFCSKCYVNNYCQKIGVTRSS